MSIKEKTKKVKEGMGKWREVFLGQEKALFWVCLVILTAFLSFGLGRLSKIEEAREPIRIENIKAESQAASISLTGQGRGLVQAPIAEENLGKTIVASKRGKKYHYVWCSGAKSIKEENKIFFATEAEAESRGYTLAANCQK